MLTSLRNARLAYHRRLIVLVGPSDENVKVAVKIIGRYIEYFKCSNLSAVYSYHRFFEDGVSRREFFSELISKYKDRISIEYVPYPETNKILGRTYDIAVIDLMNDLKPNDLGRLVGLVKGGGFLIIFLPAFNEFYKMITRFQQNLVTIGYTSSDVRHIFKKRFVRKIFEHPGIIVYDTKRKIFLKEEEVREVPRYVRRKPVIPPKTKFPKRVYELALTQDQVEVLSILENLYQKLEEDEKVAVVITADRG